MSNSEDDAVPRRALSTKALAKRQLSELLDGVTPSTTAMPLIHLTDTGVADEILTSKQIECRECNVFDKKPLAYFFVARPAYRSKRSGRKSDDVLFFPFAFVMSPDAVPSPFHVYPFDTGAVHGGKIPGARQPGIFLEDYELKADPASAQRLITWAFGSNEAYYQGQLRDGLGQDIAPWEGVARGYVRIASSPSSNLNAPDIRASTIEVASSKHVPLRGQCKLAVIPDRFIEEPGLGRKNASFLDRLQSLGIDHKTYHWQPNLTPDDHVDEIERIIGKFIGLNA